jgi:hypothetical protein
MSHANPRRDRRLPQRPTVSYTGLLQVQREAVRRHPLADLRAGRACVFLAAAEHDKVGSITHHSVAAACHVLIQRLQIVVAQTRAEVRNLRASLGRHQAPQPIYDFLTPSDNGNSLSLSRIASQKRRASVSRTADDDPTGNDPAELGAVPAYSHTGRSACAVRSPYGSRVKPCRQLMERNTVEVAPGIGSHPEALASPKGISQEGTPRQTLAQSRVSPAPVRCGSWSSGYSAAASPGRIPTAATAPAASPTARPGSALRDANRRPGEGRDTAGLMIDVPYGRHQSWAHARKSDGPAR